MSKTFAVEGKETLELTEWELANPMQQVT